MFFSEADFSLDADGTYSGYSFFQEQLAEEEEDIEDDFSSLFKIHPLISLGICFRF